MIPVASIESALDAPGLLDVEITGRDFEPRTDVLGLDAVHRARDAAGRIVAIKLTRDSLRRKLDELAAAM
jgi:hypothetical protein